MNVADNIRAFTEGDNRERSVRKAKSAIGWVLSDKLILFYVSYLLFVFFLAAFGDYIAPYGANEAIRSPTGGLLKNSEPSLAHPLGTNNRGNDLLSRLIIGARPTAITGVLGGAIIIILGLTIGVTAGYRGGLTDDVLMRLTDFAYGVPLIPFAIVLLALFGIGHITSILVIGLVLWRGSARVLRSQVLQIKERPYILVAQANGAHPLRIVRKHILPNIAPMAALFLALGVGMAILIQAGLTFIGVVDPFTPSWGSLIRNSYRAGRAGTSWYWSVPPGLLISLTVLSTFMLGREIESKLGGSQSDEAIAEGGI